MEDQNLKNYSRLVPLYHYVTGLLVLLILAGSIWKWYESYSRNIGGLLVPSLLCAIAVALFLIGFFARSFALKAQDRAIRAEENLRYFAMTGNLLDNKLTPGQIVALRFASNNEFVDLAHRAVKENLSPADIKKAIKLWKGDYYRV
jgi:hypothetical protein